MNNHFLLHLYYTSRIERVRGIPPPPPPLTSSAFAGGHELLIIPADPRRRRKTNQPINPPSSLFRRLCLRNVAGFQLELLGGEREEVEGRRLDLYSLLLPVRRDQIGLLRQRRRNLGIPAAECVQSWGGGEWGCKKKKPCPVHFACVPLLTRKRGLQRDVCGVGGGR
jgi:hypothetical protein